MTNREQLSQAYAKLIAKAWLDDKFKTELKSNPRKVMADMGIQVPDDVEIEVVENSRTKSYWILPCPPVEQIVEAENEDALIKGLMQSTCQSGKCECMSTCGACHSSCGFGGDNS